MSDSVLIDTTDGVLTITWNEPDRLNALTAEMLNDAAAGDRGDRRRTCA